MALLEKKSNDQHYVHNFRDFETGTLELVEISTGNKLVSVSVSVSMVWLELYTSQKDHKLRN